MKRPPIVVNRSGDYLVAIFNQPCNRFNGGVYLGQYNCHERVFGREEDWPIREERLSYRLNSRFSERSPRMQAPPRK